MLQALQEQANKSKSLHDALAKSFSANGKLLEGKTMDVTGTIQIRPKVDGLASVPTVSAATPIAKD